MPACTEADVALAVERARAAQPAWAARPAAERKVIFMRYHDLLLHRQDTMLDLLQLEGGRARRHALEEVLDTALNSRYYAVRAGAWLKPRRRKGALPLLTATWEHRHPLGVVGIISPWNYPLTLAIADAIPALLAGNAVVLKPASETPFTALLAVKWLHEAGLPADLIQVVTGRGSIIGSALIERVSAFDSRDRLPRFIPKPLNDVIVCLLVVHDRIRRCTTPVAQHHSRPQRYVKRRRPAA